MTFKILDSYKYTFEIVMIFLYSLMYTCLLSYLYVEYRVDRNFEKFITI
jgi:hypothetical protein